MPYFWGPKPEENATPALRVGILPVSLEVIEELLCLPTGYKIVGLSYDAYSRTVQLAVLSDALPETQEGLRLPTLSLCVTTHYSEAFPEHRRIETTIALPPTLGG